MATLNADRPTATAVLDASRQWLRKDLKGTDLVDLLRVIELALHRGQFTPDDQTELRSQVSAVSPATTIA